MGGDFSLWLFAVTSNGAKLPPLKLDLPSLGVYRVSVSSCKNCYLTTIGKDFLIFSSCFTQPNGKGYLYFASNCKQMYRPVIPPLLVWRFGFGYLFSHLQWDKNAPIQNQNGSPKFKSGLQSGKVLFGRDSYD